MTEQTPKTNQPATSPGASDSRPQTLPTPINVAMLLDRCMDDGALALKVLETFEAQVQDAVAQLARSIEARNAQEVGERGHALRGTASTVSAMQLVEAIVCIEDMARKQDWSKSEPAITDLNKESRSCLEYLPTIRQELKARRTTSAG